MSVEAVVGGAALAVSVPMLGALGAAEAHRRFVRRAPGLPELALGLFGLVGTASVITLGLLFAWRVPFTNLDAETLSSPAFAAALLGTLAGHLAVVTWAGGLGAPLGAVRAPARWFGVAAALGCGAVGLSAGWTTLAELLGRPVQDQALVASLMAAESGPGRAAVLAFVTIGAPLLEELVFRGYIQGALAGRLGAWPAILLSGGMFGLFHLSDPQVVPILSLVGVGLGWLRHRSASLGPPILAHVLNNSLAMAFAFTWEGG